MNHTEFMKKRKIKPTFNNNGWYFELDNYMYVLGWSYYSCNNGAAFARNSASDVDVFIQKRHMEDPSDSVFFMQEKASRAFNTKDAASIARKYIRENDLRKEFLQVINNAGRI